MRLNVSPLVLAAAIAVASLPALAQVAPAEAPGQASPPTAAAARQAQDTEHTADAKVPLDEIRRYVMVFNAIRQAYVDPVDDKALMDAAVRGLL